LWYRHFVPSCLANDLDIESRAVDLAFSIVKFSARVPRDLRSLNRACEYVHAHFAENLTLAQWLALPACIQFIWGRFFRQEFGETLGEYLNRIRVRAAAGMLANSDLSLSAVAVDLGFYDQSHFTRIFRQFTGATPGTFRAEYAPGKSAVAI
jgi:AraC family transcriptional regulator